MDPIASCADCAAGEANRKKKQQPNATPTTGPTTTDASSFVIYTDLGPNDVLCGRGQRAYSYPGNVAFREYAASHKATYLARGTTAKSKSAIAKSIVNHVRTKVDPPGRFLKVVDNSVGDEMGFPRGVEYWCLVDERTALEKVKMTLRQKPQGSDGRTIGSGGIGGGAADAAAAAAAALTRADKPPPTPPDDGASNKKGGDEEEGPIADSAASGGGGGRSIEQQRSNVSVVGSGSGGALPNEQLQHVGKDGDGGTLSSPRVAGPERDLLLHAHVTPGAAPPTSGDAPVQAQSEDTYASNSEQHNVVPLEGGDIIESSFQSGQLQSVRGALDLARVVRKAHDAGVSYGSSSGGNVSGGSSGGSVSGSSVGSAALSSDRIRADLVALGTVLYQHFAGVSPPLGGAEIGGSEYGDGRKGDASTATETTMPIKKKRERNRACVPLRDLGFPVSLCILVSSLLDAQDANAADRYDAPDQVEDDLCLMSADPKRYLLDAEAGMLTGQVDFPGGGRLFGRERHISNLMGVFDRAMAMGFGGAGGARREMVLVSGYSGTGKTSLVEQLDAPLAERRGRRVSGKFDELGQVQPLSVIFAALDRYCNDLVEGNDKDELAEIGTAIKDALGPHGNVLTGLIPNLGKILGVSASFPLQVEGREALNRFMFYFRVFVRAIASPSHPVVLFLDDLQWADKTLLDLVTMLVSDREISSLFFVGCYRDNEVGLDHPLHAEMQNIEAAGVGIVPIKLGNIERESVNAMISDSLHLSPRITRSLSNVVYTKTSGNPLFAVQFLRSLCDEKLLQYSALSRRWEWDADAIQSKDIADNVVDLMTTKVLKLEPEVQWLLKVAACLGSRSEASTLKLLNLDGSSSEGSEGPSYVDVAVSEGLLCKVDSVYKFSHDQIQQAAYSLIPFSERESMHLSIGRLLWSRASSDEGLKKMIFIVVDQLQRGSGLISEREEKIKVARLFLVAGDKAMASAAFVSASLYLLQGSVLLEGSDWEDNYDLSLQLFTLCAEAQYVTGAYDGAAVSLNPILAHGRCLQDKLRAYYTLIKSFGGQGKQQDTIQHGLDVLEQLNEPFPKELNEGVLMKEFAKTKFMLESSTMDGIIGKDMMLDTNKLAVMKLLGMMSHYAFQANQQLMSLIIFRMVQLSLCHGVCRESSLAFALFSSILTTFGQLEEGYRYGKLALWLLDRFQAKEYVAKVYCVVYGLTNVFTEPLQSIIPSLREGYEVGMSTGDVEWAMINADLHARSRLMCGNKLELLAEEVRTYLQQMKEHNHHTVMMTMIYLQATQNLTGNSENTTELTGEVMNQDELLRNANENQFDHAVNMVYFMRMWLGYLFGELDVAAEMAVLCRSMRKTRPNKGGNEANEAFYAGLVAVAMMKGGDESGEWRSDAMESLEKMKVWADNSAWNFQHRVCLLNAEIAHLNRNLEEAATAYGDAIRCAAQHGFVHEQAIACERAGIFYSEAISTLAATEFFERAHKLFLQWGAKRKAACLLHHVESTNSNM